MTHLLHHALGGARDPHDARDHRFEPRRRTRKLPAGVDLRPQCPPVYNQGKIASCTANAVAGAIQFCRGKHGQAPDFVPSRLFLYYNERRIQGKVEVDAGARTRDAIKVAAKLGAPPEDLWPYDATPPEQPGGAYPSGSRAAVEPPKSVYEQATRFELLRYQRIQNDLAHMKACLAEGYPFTLGILVYPSFVGPDHKQCTVTPMPGATERALGEHIVLGVGYDDRKEWLVCRNSWGPEQGDRGYFYLPYAYAGDSTQVGDLWTLRTVQD